MNEHHVSSTLQCASTRPHFRRTPVRKQLLQLVGDGRIEWRASIGPYGGFAPVGGTKFPPCNGLVALYELRNAELITVEPEYGRVYVTAAGLALLAEWEDRQPGGAVYRSCSNGDVCGG